MENQDNKNIMRKKLTSWKSYTLVAVIFWFASVLLAGSVVGDLIMALTAIPMILATIFILGGVFRKKDRDALIKRGKESLAIGVSLYLLCSIAFTNISISTSYGKSIHAMNGPTGIMLLSSIFVGIICLIRGYILPKVLSPNAGKELTKKF